MNSDMDRFLVQKFPSVPCVNAQHLRKGLSTLATICRRKQLQIGDAENGDYICSKRRQLVAVFGDFSRQCGQALSHCVLLDA